MISVAQLAWFVASATSGTAFMQTHLQRAVVSRRSGIVVVRSSSSVLESPERVAPSAGYVPDWEDREGLSTEEFIRSDMTKPDRSDMWECPLTLWDSDG